MAVLAKLESHSFELRQRPLLSTETRFFSSFHSAVSVPKPASLRSLSGLTDSAVLLTSNELLTMDNV